MTDKLEKIPSANDWRTAKSLVICEHCDWLFLLGKDLTPGEANLGCPHCRKPRLSLMDEGDMNAPPEASPELIIPHQVNQEKLQNRLGDFIGEIRFAPGDLTINNLRNRIEQVYLPMWLVDTNVNSQWEAEIGMDYEVVSHEERFGEGSGWQTREVNETRIRWEPRAGSLERTYHNVAAPALEEHEHIKKRLGSFTLKSPKGFQPNYLKDAHVRMPNRSQQDAWPAAAPALQKAAAEECRAAAGADHIRKYRWSPAFTNLHWTLLLLPVFTTYYVDDKAVVHPLLIHGQTGQTFGRKRASETQARKTAGVLLAIALLVGLLSIVVSGIGVVAPPLVVVGVLGIILAALVGVSAIIPPIMVWRFNQEQERQEREQNPF